MQSGQDGDSMRNMPGMSPAPTKPVADMKGPNMPGTSHIDAPVAANVPSSNADGVDPMMLDGQPSVDNVAMSAKDRLAEAGDGLDGNGRRSDRIGGGHSRARFFCYRHGTRSLRHRGPKRKAPRSTGKFVIVGQRG